ncbi:MFS transporter [Achromobacter xylosoxidans]|uniref:MFS transporter n=1 Tax=Alcaligenes xylosoxydans xylosoxydans TaxID=85698 RepID=UPI001F133C90|nr:MFS transporter [Achromobacter xylosoxidans]
MRYAVLALLSCQQYLAIAFLYAAVPAVLRQQGAPLPVIGLFGLVFFAFTVNFLWAPLVDRYPLTRLGRRRSWILLMQGLAAAVTASIALLDPGRHVAALLAASLLLATLAATQRIATLGYAADSLRPAQRAYGAAVMGWGMSVGNALGGAAGLYLIEAIGWRDALLSGAALMALLACLAPLLPEPAAHGPGNRAARGAWWQPGMWRAIAIIAPATFGVALAFPMAAPWLVDLGLPLPRVGLVIAAATVLAFSLAGPLAGIGLRRLPAPRAVLASTLLLTPPFGLLAAADGLLATRLWTLLSVFAIFAALAVQNVAFNAYFYSLARPGRAATDVTFLAAMMSVAAMAGFGASGFVAAAWGYGATLAAAAAGYGITALLAWRLAPLAAQEVRHAS